MSTATITDLVLEELGVPVKRVKMDLRAGDTRKPDYLKLNPNGVVPLVVHDDVPIFESAAITMYLGETFGVEKKLWPAPGTKRGEAMKWTVWANVTLGDAAMRVGRNSGEWTPKDQQNPNALAAAKKDLDDRLAILDKALAGKQFLLGDYSLVDTHVNSMADWLKYMQIDLSKVPNVTAWMGRCAARPAYQKVMAAASGK
jgi:glutathione S-transferase